MHPCFHTSKTVVYLSWGNGGCRESFHLTETSSARSDTSSPSRTLPHWVCAWRRALTRGAQVIVLFFFLHFSYTVFDLPLIRKVFKLEAYCYLLEFVGSCPICLFPHRKKKSLKNNNVWLDFKDKWEIWFSLLPAIFCLSANWFEPHLIAFFCFWFGGVASLYWALFLA